MKHSSRRTEEHRREALTRACSGQSLSNLPAIYQGFIEKGIPEDQIQPRVNVFTFDAWRALGRHVRKGEHGVKVSTWIDCKKVVRDPATGIEQEVTFRRPWGTTVFHVSQTEPRN